MTNKKMEVKRLGIFLFLAFALSWIPWIVFNQIFGYEEWFESGHLLIVTMLSLYGPALANILTRWITKEGWHDSMLHLRLKGNLKYYVIALCIPTVYGLLMGVLATCRYGEWDISRMVVTGSWMSNLSRILNIFAMAPLAAFNTFGEEFGWRAYMNQKMEPLLGTVGTCVIGGLIWGVWHAPLTVCGHNFGTDYSGFPYLGIVLMSVQCIFVGVVLMWLTKRTGSIYPAALMHAMNNNGGSDVGSVLMMGLPEDLELTMWDQLYLGIPQIILGVIFLILMLYDKNKGKAGKIVVEQATVEKYL